MEQSQPSKEMKLLELLDGLMDHGAMLQGEWNQSDSYYNRIKPDIHVIDNNEQ
ncbi:hypothetical protein [Brevibacillus dissolubilis]|uniref:hypothetical protein n=1 Tax=Brevibacillus dissolubilis TaxID=1844116 RepID=UPI00159BE4D4|nr:hypothetical protein [Brevibacillus dissolubilis]